METIDELNKKDVAKLLPNIIWMFVCLFVGIIGNTLVLLVYRLRMKTEINERYFIPILAIFDLLASTVSGLHGILNYMFHINYPSEMMCKIFNFGSFVTAAMSVHTLLLIAIQRYRKICVPFGKQMDDYLKRVSLSVVIGVSILYSWPVCLSAGLVHKEQNNQTTSLCAINSGDHPLFYKIYFSVIFLIIVSNVVAVTVLYTRIGCTIYRHRKNPDKTEDHVTVKMTKMQKLKESKESLQSSDPDGLCTDITQVSRENSITLAIVGSAQCYQNVHNSSGVRDGNHEVCSHELDRTVEENPVSKSKTVEKKGSKWTRTKVNFNKLFGAIIVFYLISYIPTLAIFLGSAFGKTNLDRNVYVFINRMYIVNNIVNSFVYGYFDFRFRHAVKSLIKCREQF